MAVTWVGADVRRLMLAPRLFPIGEHGVRASLRRRLRLFEEVLAETFEAVEALLDVRHARRVAEADVIVGAKGDAGHGGDFFLFEQFRAKVGRFQSGLRACRE